METALDVFHYSVVAYIGVGWIHNPNIHLLFMIGVFVSWFINDNQCIISKWQGKKGNEYSKAFFKKLGLNLDDDEILFTFTLFFSYVTLLSLAKITDY